MKKSKSTVNLKMKASIMTESEINVENIKKKIFNRNTFAGNVTMCQNNWEMKFGVKKRRRMEEMIICGARLKNKIYYTSMIINEEVNSCNLLLEKFNAS